MRRATGTYRAAIGLIPPLLLVGGCATLRGGTNAEPPVERVEMDPMHFVAHRGPGGLVVEARDAATLFAEGTAAFEQGRYEDAVRAYSLLLDEFPTASQAPSSRYNLALSLERAGRLQEAIAAYLRSAEGATDPKDVVDATFRIASCQEALPAWAEAEGTLASLLARTDLTEDERAEAAVRRGVTLVEMDRLDEAEESLRAVLRGQRSAEPRPLVASNQFLAQAQFTMARIEHLRFSRSPIRLPQELMQTDIEDKARAFLRAQGAYLRTMGFKDRQWSSASGLRIGALYEDFYNDLMAAPVPPELNDEERTVYFEELRKVIRPLVEKAIYVYERNTKLAEGLGEDNELLRQTAGRLDRLRTFLAAPPAEPTTPTPIPAAPPRTG